MRTPPTNICPLIATAGIGSFGSGPAVCIENRCAWWSYLAGACCIAAGADYIRDAADQLDALNTALDTLVQKKNTAPSAANTESGGKVEQSLTTSDSTSTINENGGFVK